MSTELIISVTYMVALLLVVMDGIQLAQCSITLCTIYKSQHMGLLCFSYMYTFKTHILKYLQRLWPSG